MMMKEKKKKDIVYTGLFDPTLCDGVSSTTFDLLRFLQSRGHKVAIISFVHNNSLTQHFLRHKIGHLNDGIISRGENYCHFMLKEIDIFFGVLPLSRPELIGCHPTVLKRYIKKIENHPKSFFFTADDDLTCLLAHSIVKTDTAHFIHSPARSIATFMKSTVYQKILRNNTVFSVSRFSRKELNKTLNVQAFVWPPFIDPHRFRVSRDNKCGRQIGYYSAGRHKGDFLINRLIHDMPNRSFTIIGGNYSSANKYTNVTCLGDTTQLKDFYGKISVLLVPSIIDEGYPRVILEASFNGIPVIANRIGGIPEALGHSGILIDMEQPENKMVHKYISAINTLLNEPQKYKKHCHEALERAKEYERYIFQKSIYYTNRFLCD